MRTKHLIAAALVGATLLGSATSALAAESETYWVRATVDSPPLDTGTGEPDGHSSTSFYCDGGAARRAVCDAGIDESVEQDVTVGGTTVLVVTADIGPGE
jgi:hypothetical protein